MVFQRRVYRDTTRKGWRGVVDSPDMSLSLSTDALGARLCAESLNECMQSTQLPCCVHDDHGMNRITGSINALMTHRGVPTTMSRDFGKTVVMIREPRYTVVVVVVVTVVERPHRLWLWIGRRHCFHLSSHVEPSSSSCGHAPPAPM